MDIKIADIMKKSVVTTVPHKSLGHARDIMAKNRISSIPVVDSDGEVLGIVTTSDLAKGYDEGTPVSKVLSGTVYKVPAYNPVQTAARIMRKNHIHHVVVTHEQKVAGIVSAFDLLKLVEGHRFVMKNPSTPAKRKKRS